MLPRGMLREFLFPKTPLLISEALYPRWFRAFLFLLLPVPKPKPSMAFATLSSQSILNQIPSGASHRITYKQAHWDWVVWVCVWWGVKPRSFLSCDEAERVYPGVGGKSGLKTAIQSKKLPFHLIYHDPKYYYFQKQWFSCLKIVWNLLLRVYYIWRLLPNLRVFCCCYCFCLFWSLEESIFLYSLAIKSFNLGILH